MSEIERVQEHRRRIQACFFLQRCFFLALEPANGGEIPGDFDSKAEMSVRVQKCGFMVKTLWHSFVGPNVVVETLELYPL